MDLERQFILKGAEFSFSGSAAKVLNGIDLEIRAGEWVAVLGSNGSGKSTLLKLLSALLFPTQGLCLINGTPSGELSREDVSSAAAIVFQNPEDQIVAASVEEEVAFGPENLGMPPEKIEAAVRESLEAVGLAGFEKRMTAALSGGQKQRLALAGALAMGPKAILLDEALSMLDPQSRIEFTNLIKKKHAEGMTIVEVTHRLEEIRFADRVVVLMGGKIFIDMPAVHFLRKSKKELALLGLAKPPLETAAEDLCIEGLLPRDIPVTIESILNILCR